mmetsp:Transcript_7140/g.14013  ORF Transcript_7140/g.14013 Transcript_7140/m.14013 type:complete len:99 (+) Transcript_7140:1089-1385(+)
MRSSKNGPSRRRPNGDLGLGGGLKTARLQTHRAVGPVRHRNFSLRGPLRLRLQQGPRLLRGGTEKEEGRGCMVRRHFAEEGGKEKQKETKRRFLSEEF